MVAITGPFAVTAAAVVLIVVIAAGVTSWTSWLKFVHVGLWHEDGDK